MNSAIDVNVPDGISGNWEIQTFEISVEQANAYNFGLAMQGIQSYARKVMPGKYKRLMHHNGDEVPEIVMSNTPAEIRDHRMFFNILKMLGDPINVLINGLGLGMALSVVLDTPEVNEVTVIEKSEDVINLAGPTFADDDRLTIIHADALKWKAPVGKRYNAVWHDIWNKIDVLNSATMGKLHRKYGGRCDWQWSWGRSEMKAMMRD